MRKGFCIDCIYFKDWHCHRYPPINTINNAVSDYETRSVTFGQPGTDKYNWCGEFKYKDNLIKRIYKRIWLKFHRKPNYPHV